MSSQAFPFPPGSLPSWEVAELDGRTVFVRAANWVVALGIALERLGHTEEARRLACEVLPNGMAIANDLVGRRRYVVRTAPVSDHAN